MYELEYIMITKYLYPFLSDVDVFHSRFDDRVVTESLAGVVIDLEFDWQREEHVCFLRDVFEC